MVLPRDGVFGHQLYDQPGTGAASSKQREFNSMPAKYDLTTHRRMLQQNIVLPNET